MNHSAQLQAEYQAAFKQIQALEEMLAGLSKEARAALRGTGIWQQEFDGNEIVALIAVFRSSYQVAQQKQVALQSAIDFIGKVELTGDAEMRAHAITALEAINQILVGETIEESQEKQGIIHV